LLTISQFDYVQAVKDLQGCSGLVEQFTGIPEKRVAYLMTATFGKPCSLVGIKALMALVLTGSAILHHAFAATHHRKWVKEPSFLVTSGHTCKPILRLSQGTEQFN
jgi:hypothetical protein